MKSSAPMFLLRIVLLMIVSTAISGCTIPLSPALLLLQNDTQAPVEPRDMQQTPPSEFEKPAPKQDSLLA